jgi:hypothetical protein
MARHALRPLLLALGAALALGVVGRVAVRSGVGPAGGEALVRTALALGAPWLAGAWVVGALAGSRAAGALAGAAALALGTGAWYLLTVAAGGLGAVFYAFPVAPAWAAVAAGAGALFGLAGAAWREGSRTWPVALLAGALAGEALLLAGEWSGRAAQVVLVVELVAALAIVARWRAALPAAVVCAVAFALVEGAVRDALRLAGWAGP